MTRRTAGGFTDLAPTPEQLQAILAAATRAPDHKLMRPWRFQIVRGEARNLVVVALDAAADRLAAASGGRARRQSHKPLRAPLFVVVVAAFNPDGPAPRHEQIASADCAAYALCLAAHAQGIASAWRSVPFGVEPEVRELFGVGDGEELVGWVDLGGDAGIEAKPRSLVPLESVVSELAAP